MQGAGTGPGFRTKGHCWDKGSGCWGLGGFRGLGLGVLELGFRLNGCLGVLADLV